MLGINFQRDQTAIRRQSTGEPDRTVPAECPDLEDGKRALDARENVQQLSRRGAYINRRQTGRFARIQRFDQRRVGLHEHVCNVFIDGGPFIAAHERSPRGLSMTKVCHSHGETRV